MSIFGKALNAARQKAEASLVKVEEAIGEQREHRARLMLEACVISAVGQVGQG